MTGTRDTHLFGPGLKHILVLDGGGTRGVIELAFLVRIEALLRAATATILDSAWRIGST
jgi:hypothetical protein